MDNSIYKKIYEAVRLCLDLARSPIGYDLNLNNKRLLAISPDYFMEYISQYCLENISSMTRVYDKNDRLYKNKEVFIEDFIANIIDDRERKMFHDFMWTNDELKNNILSLKSGDTYPYLSNIAGFNLEVMRYEIRDRWQAIAYIEGSRLGGAVSIKEEILPVDPISFEIIHIDLDDLKKGLE